MSSQSFVNDGRLQTPRYRFETIAQSCAFHGEADYYELTLPFDIPVLLRLTSPAIQGHAYPRNGGFAVQTGRLTGYITEADFTEIARRMQIACTVRLPPRFCADLDLIGVDDPAQVAAQVIIPLVLGLDARVDADGIAHPCRDDCNAVSVCVEFSGQPVNVLGIAEE